MSCGLQTFHSLTSRDDAASTRTKSSATTDTHQDPVLQYAKVSERVWKSVKLLSKVSKYLLFRVHHDMCNYHVSWNFIKLNCVILWMYLMYVIMSLQIIQSMHVYALCMLAIKFTCVQRFGFQKSLGASVLLQPHHLPSSSEKVENWRNSSTSEKS